MTVGEDLDELHRLMGEIDDANRVLSGLKKARYAVESRLQRAAEEQGVTSLRNDRVTVTLKEDFIAGYDPDLFPELVVWAANTGNTQILQRRISTKPIQELIDNGSELPAGVRLEPKTKVMVRRR